MFNINSVASVVRTEDIPDGFLSDPTFSDLSFAQVFVSAVLGIGLAAVVVMSVVRLLGVLFSASTGSKDKAREAGISTVIILAVIVIALNFTTFVNGLIGIF